MARKQPSQLRSWATSAVVLAVISLLAGSWILTSTASSHSLAAIESALHTGELPAAQRDIERYTAAHPHEAAAWRLQGRICNARQEYRSAAMAFEHAVALAPQDSSNRQSLGVALLQSAQFAAAENAYRELLQLQPTDESAQTELQWILFHQLRERELEVFLEECLAREPGDPRLLYHLLVSSQKPPNPYESLPVLEKIDAAVPNQPPILLGLARCAWRTGDLMRAQHLFARLDGTLGNNYEYWLVLAEFQLEQLQSDVAAETLGQIETRFPSQTAIDDRRWQLAGKLALQRRDQAKALQCFTRAMGLRPRGIEHQQMLASLLQSQGQVDRAQSLRELLDRRRAAMHALKLIVESGELNIPSVALARTISTHCRTLGKDLQADGWARLANIGAGSANPPAVELSSGPGSHTLP